MGFINLITYSAKDIKIKDNQLILSNNNASADYPLEDLNSLMIESQSCNISTYALAQLSKYNVATYFCDEKHLPCAYLLNYNGFYKNLEVYKFQTSISKPTQKQLWKQLVYAKVKNQIIALNLCGIKNDLEKYLPKIKSADTDNIEAVVANQYFKLMFGLKFARGNECLINSSLNYGYAIIRGLVARTIVSHGLLPFLGVWHKNQLNAFNLVDDIIEPFRPIIDLFVFKNIKSITQNQLTPKIKQSLFEILNYDMKIDGQNQTITNCVEILINSFVQSITKDVANLKCPELIKLALHSYE